jgi:hypothetical protein
MGRVKRADGQLRPRETELDEAAMSEESVKKHPRVQVDAADRFCMGVCQQRGAWSMEPDVELPVPMDAAAGAYRGLLPWVCMYQAMHRRLSASDRLTMASQRFRLVLLVWWMRHQIPDAERPAQRYSRRNCRVRWAMSDER